MGTKLDSLARAAVSEARIMTQEKEEEVLKEEAEESEIESEF